jgi:hypothetical protein
MVDYSQSKTRSANGIGFVVAAAIVVLVLLYALFAGGAVNAPIDPAALGAPESAPVSGEGNPTAPVATPTE